MTSFYFAPLQIVTMTGILIRDERPEDGQIGWSKPAREIYNLIRAWAHPFPGAFTFINGRKLSIWGARPVETPEGRVMRAGTVISSSPLKIGAGDGVLHVTRAQWPGGEELEGDELRLPVGVFATD